MPLCNIQEHLGCLYYVKEEDALFRHYRLDDGGNISDMNNDRSALLYIAEGCLHVVLGHYSPRKIEKGQLLFLPKNIRFCGQSVGLSRFVASFFAGGLPFCNKYDLANLRCQICRYGTCQNSLPLRKFPQIACCQKIESFFLSLSEYLDDGLNCAHFHKVKQEELCILLRCYYSPEELYTLLKFVIGNDDRFRDFVLRYYKDVNDVSAFAALAHMSVRNLQRRFKAEFKRPVLEWLNERRAEGILREICDTDTSISEIALNHGFTTQSYFTTFCKHYFGKTPLDLRRQKSVFVKGDSVFSAEILERTDSMPASKNRRCLKSKNN